MRIITFSLISIGILFILMSLYISTLIYPYYLNENSKFITQFKNYDCVVNSSVLECPYVTFSNSNEKYTILLTEDLQSKASHNFGLLYLSNEKKTGYLAFSQERIDDGLYAIEESTFYTSRSIDGTKTEMIEMINFTKVDRKFLFNQKMYKILSLIFFISGIALISLYLYGEELILKSRFLGGQTKFEDAIILSRRTLEINPENRDALLHIGNYFSLMGEFDVANIYFNRLIELYPKYTWGWHYKGLNYCEKKNYKESIRCFEKATEIEPKNGDAYYNLARVYSLLKETDKSINSLNKAMELHKIYYIKKARNDINFNNVKDNWKFNNLIKYR